MTFLSGYKTLISCVGLVGLAVYQFSQGDVSAGVQSALGALAAFGLRSAIANAVPPGGPR